MKIILQYLMSIIILFPILLLVVTYFFCRKSKLSEGKSFGIAADLTTIILFISVPLLFSVIWGWNINLIVICFAIIIAIIFTYIDWKTKKEIEIRPLIKKVWRFYFLFLTASYILIWIVGLIHNIIKYVFVV